MQWILIVITSTSIGIGGATMSGKGYGESVAMQEFNDFKSCQWAGLSIAKRYKALSAKNSLKTVCVPKGQP